MSYDVSVQCKHCGGHRGDLNVTYNVTRFYYDVLDKEEGLRILRNMYSEAAIPILDAAIEKARGLDLSTYDANNGWGTGQGALDLLVELRGLCTEIPEGVIHII